MRFLWVDGPASTEMVSRVWPEWKPDSEFLGSSFFRARQLDAKLSSHPVEVECPDEDSILQIFDALSYSKAASGAHPFLASSEIAHSVPQLEG